MDEIFKNNTYKILELFIEFPSKDFSIRSIARNLNLSHATVIKYIDNLFKLKLIKKKEETLYPTYYASVQGDKYKFYKRNYLVFKIMNCGIIEYIQKEVLPSSIILFGSGSKATFTNKSDIDIFVESKDTKIIILKYEKILGHKINLLFEPDIYNLSKELHNNINNGTVLYGLLKIR
jgi:predicted nucleotidyltransferase/predicted transcriptional regulator